MGRAENRDARTGKPANETVKCCSCLEFIGRGEPVSYLNRPGYSRFPFHPECAKRLFTTSEDEEKEES